MDWPGWPSFPKQSNVDANEQEDHCWNQKHMGKIKARQRERSQRVATAQHICEPLSNEWNFSNDVRSYFRGKIGTLIPREKIACEAHTENQTGQERA